MNDNRTRPTINHTSPGGFKSTKWLLFLSLLLTAVFSEAQTFSTNRTPVGMEHNLLFKAPDRYVVAQSPSNALSLNLLFDGKFSSTGNVDVITNDYQITIENLPEIHVQAGAWVGWSTRSRYPTNFLIEGWDTYSANNWVILADHTTISHNEQHFSKKVPSGRYTKLRFTFYESSHTSGTIQLTELFFIHPEATTPYEGLFDNTSGSTSSVWNSANGHATFEGNVGIGTAVPSSPLHIDQDDPLGLRFSRDHHDTYEFYLSGSNGLNIRNKTDARDEMVFLGNGNIGVGTSNPSELFTINQGSNASGLSIQRNGYDDYNLSLQGGKGLIIRNNSDSRDEMVFSGTGRVGIGTDNPAKELEVAGDLVLGKSGQSGKVHFRRSLDGGIRGFVGFTSGTNYQDIKICNETGGGWLTFLTNDGTSTQERMRVNADGNVGIGTSAPDQKLTVNGKINAEEIILEDVAGADFVFEEDYDLRSLEATEAFIKANKHLPEVPSAAEMAEEGLAIKEMNILLLQKIEELTLHMIRMEKEIEDLKATQNN